MTARRPQPAVRDLNRFEHGLHGWRALTIGHAVIAALFAGCGSFGAGGVAGLLGSLTYLALTLSGTVVLVLSLSRAITALDPVRWTVSVPGLMNAQSLSLLAGVLFVGALCLPPAVLLAVAQVKDTGSFLILLLPLAMLLLVLPITVAFAYARYYGQLARWHQSGQAGRGSGPG